jgi:DNA-binding NarL/FixJ family response regulator
LSDITVFVCEPQPIVVEGLERVFAAEPGVVFAGSRPNLAESLDAVRELQPDVILIDQAAGLKQSLQFLIDAKSVSSGSRGVLWVTELAEVECFRVLQMGARGILKKSMPISVLLECVQAVASGIVWVESPPLAPMAGLTRRGVPRLTPREREIVHHVCRGMKNKEIAESLSITAGTVKVHLMHIFEKTGVKDRFELAIHGRRLTGDV